MTKLMEWLLFASIFLVAWAAIVTRQVKFNLIEPHMTCLLYLPFTAVVIFGLYAASVVLYRVFTFNNCDEAASELQEQIVQAKEDLKKKGFIFQSVNPR